MSPPPPGDNYISIVKVDFDRLFISTFKYDDQFRRSADLPSLTLVNQTITPPQIPLPDSSNVTSILASHIPDNQKFRTPVYVYHMPGSANSEEFCQSLQTAVTPSTYLNIKCPSQSIDANNLAILNWAGLNYRSDSFPAPHAIIDITGYSLSVVLPPRFLAPNHPKLAKVGLAHKQEHQFFDIFSEDIKLDIPPEIIEGCTPPLFSTKDKKYKGNFAQCEVALNSITEQFVSSITDLKSKPQFILGNGFDAYFKQFDKNLENIGNFCGSTEPGPSAVYMNACLHSVLASKIIKQISDRGIKFTPTTTTSDFELGRALFYADVDLTSNDEIGIGRYLDQASPEWVYGKKDSIKRPPQTNTHIHRWAGLLVILLMFCGAAYFLIRRWRRRNNVAGTGITTTTVPLMEEEFDLDEFEV